MSAINLETLAERKEELDEFFDELIDTYLDDVRNLIQRVKTAVENDDATELREAAHAIKSSSGFMGAEKVVVLSAELEAAGRSGTAAAVSSDAKELQEELIRACAELEQQKTPA